MAPSAAQRDRADIVAELRIGFDAGIVHRRHPDAIGDREILLRLVVDEVDAEAQLEALGQQVLVGIRRAQTIFLRQDFGLVEDHAG